MAKDPRPSVLAQTLASGDRGVIKRALLLGIFFVTSGASVGSARSDTLAVLSSDMAPYKEAFSGFREALGQSVDEVQLSSGALQVTGEPRVIVAFGGRAAHEKYPESSILIYCMAPGIFVSTDTHSGLSVPISMMPDPSVLLSKLKGIQPGLKRMAVLWSSPAFKIYAQDAARQALEGGITILADRLIKPDDLPARLRYLKDKVDALWLPSDPLLINNADIVIITQFALANHVPLYTAVAGLANQGAVASVFSTYRDIGRAAGRAAKRALAGGSLADPFYPNAIMMTVNRQSAAKVGLELPEVIPGETRRLTR